MNYVVPVNGLLSTREKLKKEMTLSERAKKIRDYCCSTAISVTECNGQIIVTTKKEID